MKYFYLSANFDYDERIKFIETLPEGDKICWIWFNLVSSASKYREKENLRNCLKRKKLPSILINNEFLKPALEILEKANLLDIKSINNIVRFEIPIEELAGGLK